MKRLFASSSASLFVPAVSAALCLSLGGASAFAQHEGHGPECPDHAAHSDAHSTERPEVQDETLADYFWRKSDAAFHAGDYERAVGLHKAIVAADPTDVESYGVAAWLMWSMGRVDDSNAHIEQGLRANPQESEMWDAAGQHYDLQKKHALARDSYQKAIELAGPRAAMMLRRRLAHASEHAGDYALSIRTWQQLVRDFPDDAVNKNNLARVEEAAKKTPAARVETASVPVVLGATLLVGLSASLARSGRHS